MNRLLFSVTGLVLAVSMTAPAFARGGNSGRGAGSPSGFTQGQKQGWNNASTPPGWSHGKKTGWGTGTMPPGLSNR